jgi:beta-lysine N6-acetyltransferase
MTDEIISRLDAIIQHGRHNDRIYLMRLPENNIQPILEFCDSLARKQGYGKIFAKARIRHSSELIGRGYDVEAKVPRFFDSGKEGCIFASKYLLPERMKDDMESIKQIVTLAKHKKPEKQQIPSGYSFTRCSPEDASQMAALYSKVFPSYPFPIMDAEYLKKQMIKDTIYYKMVSDGEIAALSSAECDKSNGNAELTDMIVVESHRGRGLSAAMIVEMEKDLPENILTYYTICRAKHPPVNIAFAKNSYSHAGTLIKNTNISGHMESMNIWYKNIRP